MSKNQEYIEQYKELAQEQMRRYGIPASITLAQAILESASGQSRLARNENNHFGIKATPQWIANGGRYGLYSDDKPNEKFCSYDSVADSYEHHSQFLKQNRRYAACFSLQPNDYRGWAWALDRAGYATAGQYAPSLISIIEKNNLQQYDNLSPTLPTREGVLEFPLSAETSVDGNNKAPSPEGRAGEGYSFPVKRTDFLFVSSPFGMRTDPMDKSKQQMHKGIDIRCRDEDVLATEDKGKVVAVNHNANTAGGKSVTVEYSRADGTKVRCSYLHLSSIDVKVGDAVHASQKLGVSGNTGTRTTGPHLHFGVKQIAADGTERHIDPAAYLADIAVSGNIPLKAMHNGKDLLAKYRSSATPINTAETMPATESLALLNLLGDTDDMTPDSWMKKLLSSEDSGVSMDSTGDPIIELAITLFSSLMLLATQIDSKSETEQMEAATEAAISRKIDLNSLVPYLKKCSLAMLDNGKTILQMVHGSDTFSHELTTQEMTSLQSLLADSSLTNEQKQQQISAFIGNALATERAAQNYDNAIYFNNEQNMQLR